jgi:hypothetical protein
VRSAMGAVMRTPQFQALVSQHAKNMGLSGGSTFSPRVTGPGPQVRQSQIGFQQRGMAPGATYHIQVVAQAPFKADRLVVPDEYADALIHSIIVGNREQLMGTALPAAAFGPRSTAGKIQMDTALPAQAIVLVVSRPAGGDFTAMLMGATTAEGGVMGDPMPESIDPLVEEAQKALQEADEAYEVGITIEELEALGVPR